MPKKIRRLWLNVTAKGIDVPKREFIARLIESVNKEEEDGSKLYTLPDHWKVTLHWSNEEGVELKKGPWKKVLEESAEVSPGFDFAVATWLSRKL